MKRITVLVLVIALCFGVLPVCGDSAMTGNGTWTCNTCEKVCSTTYCPNDGTKRPEPGEKNFVWYCTMCGKECSGNYCPNDGTKRHDNIGTSIFIDPPVNTASKIMGYEMVVYVTQQNKSPHYRVFRDFSIHENYKDYAARPSYGEKCFTLFIAPEILSNANMISQGEYTNESRSDFVSGYNKGSKCAYLIPISLDDQGRCYPMFIDSVVYYNEKDRNHRIWNNYYGRTSMTVSSTMPGTDCNYSVLDTKLENCVGICFSYQVTELWNGNCDGTRFIEICSDEYGWHTIDTTFEYSKAGGIVTVIARWNNPVTLTAFGTARVQSDSSSFNFKHDLKYIETVKY